MTNLEKLKNLMVDVFLLEEGEFNFDLKKKDIETWDSLGVVAMAVGVQETFGYHMSAEEATAIDGIRAIIDLLETKGFSFEE